MYDTRFLGGNRLLGNSLVVSFLNNSTSEKCSSQVSVQSGLIIILSCTFFQFLSTSSVTLHGRQQRIQLPSVPNAGMTKYIVCQFCPYVA